MDKKIKILDFGLKSLAMGALMPGCLIVDKKAVNLQDIGYSLDNEIALVKLRRIRKVESLYVYCGFYDLEKIILPEYDIKLVEIFRKAGGYNKAAFYKIIKEVFGRIGYRNDEILNFYLPVTSKPECTAKQLIIDEYKDFTNKQWFQDILAYLMSFSTRKDFDKSVYTNNKASQESMRELICMLKDESFRLSGKEHKVAKADILYEISKMKARGLIGLKNNNYIKKAMTSESMPELKIDDKKTLNTVDGY